MGGFLNTEPYGLYIRNQLKFRRHMKISVYISVAMSFTLLLALTACSIVTPSEKPGIGIKVLLRTTLSGDESKEVIVASAEFPRGSTTGRHIHPGDEYATVLEGTLELLVEGQQPKRVNAGESYHNAANVIHETRNIGDV